MDPRSQTQEEAALLAKIAEDIVGPEVVENLEQLDTVPQSEFQPVKKEKDDPSREETPKVETPTDHPAETTQSVTDIDWESLREPNGLILGKYKDPQNAAKGVSHAVIMAKQAFSKVDELEQEVARLKAIPAPQPAQPTYTPDRQPEAPTELDAVLTKIVNDGGTIDETNMEELRAALNTQSKTIAASTVEELLNQRELKLAKESQAWNEVDNHMRQNFPDSLKFTDEIGLFVKTDPLYGPAVRSLIKNGELVNGAILAWKGYQEAQNTQTQTAQKAADEKKEVQLSAADQVRKEAVDKARRDAGVIPTSAGGVHENPQESSNQEEIDSAAALMRNTGDGAEWRRRTIGKDLVGPWFDNL